VIRALDLAILRALRGHRGAPGFERAVLVFTRAGEHGVLWQLLCIAGAVLDRGRRQLYLRALRTVAIAYLANIVLKHVVRRKRPVIAGLPALSSTVTDLSFPSAHSTTSFAAARSLSAGGLPAVPLYGVATAMAVSRVYVGVHYPTDVVAGAAMGFAMPRLLEPSR
jgi:undecaprenyl-diphosphatase